MSGEERGVPLNRGVPRRLRIYIDDRRYVLTENLTLSIPPEILMMALIRFWLQNQGQDHAITTFDPAPGASTRCRKLQFQIGSGVNNT
jgi:hypothetical protein